MTTPCHRRDRPASGAETVRKVLQRFVLPADRDLDVVPLYVDTEPAVLDADKDVDRRRAAAPRTSTARPCASRSRPAPPCTPTRSSTATGCGSTTASGSPPAPTSTASPASYWRRWTVVEEVTLDITVSGPGATVTVYRSMANGRSQRVDSATTTEKGANHFEFDLSLTPFVDGGWYWFDVVAGDADVVDRGGRAGSPTYPPTGRSPAASPSASPR